MKDKNDMKSSVNKLSHAGQPEVVLGPGEDECYSLVKLW